MKKLSNLIIIVAIILFVFVISGLSEPVEHDNEIIEIPVFTQTNPCTGESITFSGTMHINDFLMTNPAGVSNYQMCSNMHLVGIGNYGNEYIANSVWTWKVVSRDIAFPIEWNKVLIQLIISKGEETNSMLKMKVHVIVNANGEITVWIDEEELICVGENP
jgi:hypothetical protein